MKRVYKKDTNFCCLLLPSKGAVWLLCIFIILMDILVMADEREKLLKQEKKLFSGDIDLNDNEVKVNRYLLAIKKEELSASYKDTSSSLPSRNFLLARNKIEQSKVFQFIKEVPKGASLHTHILAGVGIDWIISNITYNDNIYGCYINDVFKLKVLSDPKQDPNCSWKSVSTYRKEYEAENKSFDEFLKNTTTLGLDTLTQTKEQVWNKFKTTFTTLYDLVAYKPVFKRYVRQLLEELYEDNVLYTELRGTFMPLYDLNGTTYDVEDFLDTFIETVEEFKQTHPEFIGLKYIYNVYRGVDDETLRTNLEQIIYYKSLYPEFIAGFDFVGLEEDGKDLAYFYKELLGVSNDIKFFFHAGETNQFGHTDLNLVDAILLNSSRIGHGYALAKHPILLDEAKKRNIAIELCPISNQVLKLVDDLRNHPGAVLLSTGQPVVICNDDPSVWSSTGLSYDWYMVFMAMTWEDHGLEVLKKLAINSIEYSAMNAVEKTKAFETWNRQWNRFIDKMIQIIN